MSARSLSPCLTLAASLLATLSGSCGGGAPPSQAPEPAAPEAPPVPQVPAQEAEPPVESAEESQGPRTVNVDSVEVEGGGIDEATVREALTKASAAYEECFATTLKTAPDAKGTVSVTLLYVKGKRKSAAASYAGPGNAAIMRCFTEASQTVELSPAADVGRTTISIRLKLQPPAP